MRPLATQIILLTAMAVRADFTAPSYTVDLELDPYVRLKPIAGAVG